MIRYIFIFICIVWNTESLAANASKNTFAKRQDVQAFIQKMSDKHGFQKAHLTALFDTITSEPKIIQLMDKPSEALPWYRYQELLLSQERVKEGVKFWKKHARILNAVSKKYGVPPEMIVAILGIETFYGQRTGKYPVLQSLSTLSFDYPRRAAFFKGELEQFLLLVKEEGLHPTKTLGSYSGAIGGPQFMPSSYRRFAVAFEGKGKRDLVNRMDDTIASVANYFKVHGWQRGEKVAVPARLSGKNYKTLVKQKSDPKPNLTLKELAQYDIQPWELSSSTSHKTKKAKFIALQSGKNKIEPWLGFDNFYVITRYNHSTHYAMVVHLLSQRIRASY